MGAIWVCEYTWFSRRKAGVGGGGGGVKVTPSHICQCRAIPCGTVITYKCLR